MREMRRGAAYTNKIFVFDHAIKLITTIHNLNVWASKKKLLAFISRQNTENNFLSETNFKH